MDRDTLARLQPLLDDRHGSAEMRDVSAAVNALSIARRHCAYGWVDRAEADYRWLAAWMAHAGSNRTAVEGRP